MATSAEELKKRAATNNNGSIQVVKGSFPDLLEKSFKEIERALPKHLNPDRMSRIALTCYRTVPKLAECDPRSVIAAVIQASQLGLEPGLSQEAHLIPYWNGKKKKYECQMIPGYPGILKLCYNSGKIDSIEAKVAYDNDFFDVDFGVVQDLKHRPEVDRDRGQPRLVWGIAFIKGAIRPLIDVMSKKEVYAVRDRSSGYKNAAEKGWDNPWIDPDTETEMWRKTMLRRISKQLPKSPELVTALTMSDLAERGKSQNLDLDSVIEGEYSAIGEDEESSSDGAEDK